MLNVNLKVCSDCANFVAIVSQRKYLLSCKIKTIGFAKQIAGKKAYC